VKLDLIDMRRAKRVANKRAGPIAITMINGLGNSLA
jgi:hypothetical protein